MQTLLPVVHWMIRNSVAVTLPVFLLIAASLYWPGRRARIERHGLIPLDDER
jgi:hypothetical protein